MAKQVKNMRGAGTMRLVDGRTGEMVCTVCGHGHFASIRPGSGGLYSRGSWTCRHGCKRPSDGALPAEEKEAAHCPDVTEGDLARLNVLWNWPYVAMTLDEAYVHGFPMKPKLRKTLAGSPDTSWCVLGTSGIVAGPFATEEDAGDWISERNA